MALTKRLYGILEIWFVMFLPPTFKGTSKLEPTAKYTLFFLSAQLIYEQKF